MQRSGEREFLAEKGDPASLEGRQKDRVGRGRTGGQDQIWRGQVKN